jgi:uncharacterized protein YdeI (YjbR/CyaY-like superfamily)
MQKPTFFAKGSDFYKWLEKNHEKETELIVGFWKTHTAKPSMTWSESVDQVLCFGWIDGVRRSIDEDSYTIRFTPRKPTSIWSKINIDKVEALTKQGLMRPAGMAAFEKRTANKSKVYSFEQENIAFDKKQEKLFKANKKAWEFFQSAPPSYRKPATWYVISAKQEATREKRLNELISDSENGLRIKHLRPSVPAYKNKKGK